MVGGPSDWEWGPLELDYVEDWMELRHGGQESEVVFKSFLTGSQDLKVNLFGLQQDKRSDGNGKNNDVGIAG